MPQAFWNAQIRIKNRSNSVGKTKETAVNKLNNTKQRII